MRRLTTLLIKEQIDEGRLAGAAAVVIDVFLSTTTILTILERGARGVYPAPGPDVARALAVRLELENVIFGGEEEGRPVKGFHLGPLPDEYTETVVRGRTVVFSSTNGTRAAYWARQADPLLLACFRNAPVTAAYLRQLNPERLYLICCGSRSRLALEDFLCAGLIASLLDLDGVTCDDATWLAIDVARRHLGNMIEVLRRSDLRYRPHYVLDLLVSTRTGLYFWENGLHDLLKFVGDVGASSSVVMVNNGCARIVEWEQGERRVPGEKI